MIITKQNLNKVGGVLKQVRETEGISQTSLAQKMKKNQPFVSNVESTRKIPSLATVVNYLTSMGYSIVIKKDKK